jgi:AcrR family transcriptional regulator
MKESTNVRVGRPSKEQAEALSNHVIAVADAMFLEKGYSSTSMAMVATSARIGKQTLYRRFPSKEVLFRAVIRRRIDTVIPSGAKAAAGKMPLVALKELGRAALDLVLDAEFIGLHRIIIAEASGFPELARSAADNFGSSLTQHCVDAIRQGQALGVCRQGEPATIALCFLWSLIGDAFISGLIGIEPKTDISDREAHLEVVWHIFSHGIRSRW